MRLLLIRHGETVHNVAGVYAGTTDSPLTNHGVLQASRLGSYLYETGVKVVRIFSSDLQRAYKTAETIRDVQSPAPPGIMKLALLREQDFGSYEGVSFVQRTGEGSKTGKGTLRSQNESEFRDVESIESMILRMETFIDMHLVQQMLEVEKEYAVAVVAHGIILSHLWRAILRRFHPGNVTVAPDVQTRGGFSLEHLGAWRNTGYLDLEVKPKTDKLPPLGHFGRAQSGFDSPPSTVHDQVPEQDPAIGSSHTGLIPTPNLTASTIQVQRQKLLNMSLLVKAVHSQEHLKGLKKTRGGIGSSKYDSTQKTVDSFFKKRST